MAATSPPASPPAPAKSPLAELLAIAVPTVATMTSYTLMTFVDKLMSSRIGPDPIYVGAQGNGGLSSWVMISVIFGVLTIVNTFVSQNLGAGKPERGAAYAWNGLWIALVAYAVILIPYGLALPSIYAALRDPALPAAELERVLFRDQMAADYARILIFTACFTLASRALSQYFYGMHKAGIVMVASIAGNILNFLCNSLFIYGPQAPAPTGWAVLDAWFAFTANLCSTLGIPRLGVPGAAWGTVIGTLLETAILFAAFLGPKANRLYHTRAAWRPQRRLSLELLKIGWPAGVMFGNEMICWGLFMVAFVGKFGTQHSTAGWIAHQWMSLSFMPAVGISVAVTAVVGKYMGMGQPDVAARRARLGLVLAMTYMGLCAVAFVVFRAPLTRFFIPENTPPEAAATVLALGSKFLILTAIFQLFDAIAMTLSGALRGAGDTVFVGIVTVVSSWLIIVGGGLAAVHFFPQYESLGPWAAAAAYIICLSLFVLGRFLSGKWKHIKLVDRSPSPPAPPADPTQPAANPQATAGLAVDPSL